jgi:hypothetical protein
MNKRFFILTLFSCLILATCGLSKEDPLAYNLKQLKFSYTLPEQLHEISGLTDIDATKFACIQDENGILFIYDALKNELSEQYSFNVDGDYEGITYVNGLIYILRSDGMLFEISDYDSEKIKLVSYTTNIPAKDNEGLCYDPINNRLLIACKSKLNKEARTNDEKHGIYSFDLVEKKLSAVPAFSFNVKKIQAFALDKGIPIPSKTKKNGIVEPKVKFQPSAIAVHPYTKKLFLLSASEHLLYIFDMNGEIQHIEKLDPKVFNKAEGITFFENGDLLISNEGQGGKPTLLGFSYLKK